MKAKNLRKLDRITHLLYRLNQACVKEGDDEECKRLSCYLIEVIDLHLEDLPRGRRKSTTPRLKTEGLAQPATKVVQGAS